MNSIHNTAFWFSLETWATMNHTCHKMQLFQILSTSPTTLLFPYLQIAPIPRPLLAAHTPTLQQVLDQEVHFSSQVSIYFINTKKIIPENRQLFSYCWPFGWTVICQELATFDSMFFGNCLISRKVLDFILPSTACLKKMEVVVLDLK